MLTILLFIKLGYTADNEEGKVVYKQKTEIDFEELEIEGTLERPSSSLIQDRKSAKFNPLIKLRENWEPEINQSIGDIK